MNRKQAFIKVAADLSDFFTQEVAETAAKQGLKISDPTTQYLASVLMRFTDTRHLIKKSESEKGAAEFPVLAQLWMESLSVPITEQYFTLQKLGDLSLFMTGFFRERIERKRSVVDMDYYQAMGEMAYQRAGHIRESIQAEKALNIFFELSKSFAAYVEIFAEINDKKLLQNDQDLLKLYEKWLHSGSQRLSRMLAEAGIIPARGQGSGEPLS